MVHGERRSVAEIGDAGGKSWMVPLSARRVRCGDPAVSRGVEARSELRAFSQQSRQRVCAETRVPTRRRGITARHRTETRLRRGVHEFGTRSGSARRRERRNRVAQARAGTKAEVPRSVHGARVAALKGKDYPGAEELLQ